MLIKQHGIRNAVMLTIPPCGTISMLHGVSSGIEPIFAAMYMRRWRTGNVQREELMVDPVFQEYYNEGKSLDAFVGAYDVTPEEHMAVQECIQRYIDSCISKTINLPEEVTAAQFNDTALEYARNLKGLTVYRAGSKGTPEAPEPLKAIPFTKENIEKYMSGEQEATAEVQSSEACSLTGGGCGS
jgi:ribonucleoside-diphosphate reductase alpha chain